MRNADVSGRGANRRNTQYYVDGSAARKLTPREDGQQHRRQASPDGRRAHSRRMVVKAAPMNKGYIAVMVAAVLIVSGLLMGYVKMQSDITNHINTIADLESRLNELKLANDETYTKIMSNVDLEEIKRIAVSELGMKYAKEGQVVQYTGEGNDYVRQYSDIPQ